MAGWWPDWKTLLAQAPELRLGAGSGHVYLVADSHLGDARAPVADFLKMLQNLPDARLVVLMGDLFKVWMAPPKFWDAQAHALIDGLTELRARGTPVWFVVGNREFFVPSDPRRLFAIGLPFDAVVPNMAVLTWQGRRYGLSHGDLVNRKDAQYLRWRRLCRSAPFAALFQAIPGPVARRIATRLERSMAATNSEIKISWPAEEVQAFARTVLPGLDGFFIGHFHRDERIETPGERGLLRIVPDWFSKRTVLRLHPDGYEEVLSFDEEGRIKEAAGQQRGG